MATDWPAACSLPTTATLFRGGRWLAGPASPLFGQLFLQATHNWRARASARRDAASATRIRDNSQPPPSKFTKNLSAAALQAAAANALLLCRSRRRRRRRARPASGSDATRCSSLLVRAVCALNRVADSARLARSAAAGRARVGHCCGACCCSAAAARRHSSAGNGDCDDRPADRPGQSVAAVAKVRAGISCVRAPPAAAGPRAR